MFTPRHDFKVFRTIVKSVAVLVVNYFHAMKLSAKNLFHHKAMLSDVFVVNPESSITKGVDGANPSRVYFGGFSVTVPEPPSIVHGAETIPVYATFAPVDRTVRVSKSWTRSSSSFKSLVVHGAKTFGNVKSSASFNLTGFKEFGF